MKDRHGEKETNPCTHEGIDGSHASTVKNDKELACSEGQYFQRECQARLVCCTNWRHALLKATANTQMCIDYAVKSHVL